MRCVVLCACLTASAATIAAAQEPVPSRLLLELRVFDGLEEVTAQTRVTVHQAGTRGEPLAQTTSPDGRVQLQVPSGIYDVQAIHERDGRVLNIRWANRLIVMPYPDEAGKHLEVINFKPGYGALQIRAQDKDAGTLDIAIYELGKHEKPVTAPITAPAYTLFIVPAGTYDLQVRKGVQTAWHPKIDVPLDRTRLWIAPTAF